MNTMSIIDALLAGEIPAGTARVVITTAGGCKIRALAWIKAYPPETPWKNEAYVEIIQAVNRLVVNTIGGRVPCVAVDVEPSAVMRDGRTVKCHPLITRTKASLAAGVVEAALWDRDDDGNVSAAGLDTADKAAMAAAEDADRVLAERHAVKDRIRATKAVGSARTRRAAAEEATARARRAAVEATARLPYGAPFPKWSYGRAASAAFVDAKNYARKAGRFIARLKAKNAAL